MIEIKVKENANVIIEFSESHPLENYEVSVFFLKFIVILRLINFLTLNNF